jgi:cytochrome c biogenesis protein CcmG, thiol:disulfide interchange protein DsbE
VGVLVAFTVWINWRAKMLESHLGRSGQVLVGHPGPPFRLASLDGRTLSSEELRGKGKLVVSFWASWCDPCRKELPALARLYQKTHGSEARYELVAISIDADREDAQRAAAQMKLPFTVLLDPTGATSRTYGVQGIPATFVIDESGTVMRQHEGYQAGLEVLLASELGRKDYNPWAGMYDRSSH